MPIYGYACGACGHTLDALQKIADAPLVDCPDCGKPALERQLSAPRFRLKGKGWYETDFKSDKDNKRNLAGEAEPAKAEGKAEAGSTGKDAGKDAGDGKGKSDSKPETKTEKSSAEKAPKVETKTAKTAAGDKAGNP